MSKKKVIFLGQFITIVLVLIAAVLFSEIISRWLIVVLQPLNAIWIWVDGTSLKFRITATIMVVAGGTVGYVLGQYVLSLL